MYTDRDECRDLRVWGTNTIMLKNNNDCQNAFNTERDPTIPIGDLSCRTDTLADTSILSHTITSTHVPLCVRPKIKILPILFSSHTHAITQKHLCKKYE